LKDAENLYWIGMKNKYAHEQIEATNCFFGLGLFFGFYLGQKKQKIKIKMEDKD